LPSHPLLYCTQLSITDLSAIERYECFQTEDSQHLDKIQKSFTVSYDI